MFLTNQVLCKAFLEMALVSKDPELIRQETDACNANPMSMQLARKGHTVSFVHGTQIHRSAGAYCPIAFSLQPDLHLKVPGLVDYFFSIFHCRCKAYYRQVRNATDAEIAACSKLRVLLIRGPDFVVL